MEYTMQILDKEVMTSTSQLTENEQWRERYDRVIDFLKQVSAGSITPTLPIATDEQGNPVIKSRFGSNPKFDIFYKPITKTNTSWNTQCKSSIKR